jgi:SPP1 gp7 family putative phage head morphogenesis protein
MADPTFAPLPPAEAIRHFEAKGLKVGFNWQDVWQDEHAGAFTVAKMAQADLLADVQRSLAENLRTGATFEDWRKGIQPLLEARGWWGRKMMVDPADGVAKLVQLGSPRRLEVIYDTNMRMAYASGQYERIEKLAPARPFLRYVAVLDGRTRPAHAEWNGTILPIGDPWWDTHYPPCGWFCRCTVQQLSQRDLDRRGWTVTAPPASPTRGWTNARTGQTQELPEGIDPGFGYHPGKAARQADAARRLCDAATPLPPAIGAAVVPAGQVAPALAGGFEAWYRGLDITRAGADGLPARNRRPTGETKPVTILTREVLEGLAKEEVYPQSAVVAARDNDLSHAQRAAHAAEGIMVPHEVMARLPEHMASADVYWDRSSRALVYVFDAPGNPDRPKAKVVIPIDIPTKLKHPATGARVSVPIAALKTAFLIDPQALADRETFVRLRRGVG